MPDLTKTPASKLIRAFVENATPQQLTPDQQAARRWPLAEFARQAWHVIEPGRTLQWSWHHDAICEHLAALINGTLDTRNLLISTPPGTTKSTLVSVMLPCWHWVNNPEHRSIFATGAAPVATRDSLKRRSILESAWYRNTFAPQWTLAGDQNEKLHFANTRSGFCRATTAGAKITGDRADALFVDDPLDASDSYSKSARDAINIDWWSQAFANRVSDPSHAIRVIIAQRLHEEDLPGFVLASEPNAWTHLRLSMLYEPTHRCTTRLPWADPRTEPGELLDPVRFPPDVIASERLRLGVSGFAGQMMQQPSAAEGEVFKVGHLRLLDVAPACSQIVISIDSAFKVKKENDYSVGVVMGQFNLGVFIFDILRGRYTYPELKAVMIELAMKWNPSAVLIEDKASGQSLIQDLRASTSLPIKAIQVDTDKLSRAHVCVPSWEAGRVHALKGAAFLQDFTDELHAFPKGRHDDQVDAYVQAQTMLIGSGVPAILGWLDREAKRVVPLVERPNVVSKSIDLFGHGSG